jgi:DNA-binding transcriptional LysR family regulator
LSDAGRVFLDDARALLARLGDVQERARRAAEGKVGLLRGAFNEVVSRHPTFREIFLSFHRRVPNINVKLSLLGTQAQLTRLEQRLIDFGLLFVHADSTAQFVCPDGCDSLPFGEDDFGLVMLQSNPLCEKPYLKLDDLRDHPLIQGSRRLNSLLYDRIINAGLTHGVVLHLDHEADSEAACVNLVRAGLGSAILPLSFPLDHYADLRIRKISDFSVPVQFHLIWRTELISPSLERFIEIAREACANAASPVA